MAFFRFSPDRLSLPFLVPGLACDRAPTQLTPHQKLEHVVRNTSRDLAPLQVKRRFCDRLVHRDIRSRYPCFTGVLSFLDGPPILIPPTFALKASFVHLFRVLVARRKPASNIRFFDQVNSERRCDLIPSLKNLTFPNPHSSFILSRIIACANPSNRGYAY